MAQFVFKRTGDANYPKHMNILVMGPPKSGKTTFVSTAPNVVVAACEAGLMSIAHMDVPYVEVTGSDKLETLALMIEDPKMRAQAAANWGLPDIETIAIDTADALQDILKNEILREQRRTQMQQADWGTLKERMTAIIKKFASLPVNLIITVHVDVTQDENGRQIYAPGLQGSIKNEIAGLVDFSLMSFREKQTDAQGVSAIRYFLKNEGDEKNPHLGNRSQGRVPEITDPDFKTLHMLTFAGIQRPIEEEPDPPTIEITSVSAPEVIKEVAQTPSQPTGIPTPVEAPDAEEKINTTGVTMLTKEYKAQDFPVPSDLKDWSLIKARTIAKFFVAWKADIALGRETKQDLIDFLIASDAYEESDDSLQTPGQTPESEVATAEPAADTPPTPEPVVEQQTDEGAVALAEQELGGKVIGMQIQADANCEVCGNTIDDIDIAHLGWGRLQKVLCVSDYKDLIKNNQK